MPFKLETPEYVVLKNKLLSLTNLILYDIFRNIVFKTILYNQNINLFCSIHLKVYSISCACWVRGILESRIITGGMQCETVH